MVDSDELIAELPVVKMGMCVRDADGTLKGSPS